MKQQSEERTGLSVWWKEAGWRRLTLREAGHCYGKCTPEGLRRRRPEKGSFQGESLGPSQNVAARLGSRSPRLSRAPVKHVLRLSCHSRNAGLRGRRRSG